jgi:hypothetical protein
MAIGGEIPQSCADYADSGTDWLLVADYILLPARFALLQAACTTRAGWHSLFFYVTSFYFYIRSYFYLK